MRLCVIPARGGSKRIPRKNIKEFCGKPMIAHSILAAISSGLFDKVMVSTDDEEIAETAIKFGAEVPFLRSAINSNDYSGTGDVAYEVISEYASANVYFSVACCIYATAPLIRKRRLHEGFDLFSSGRFDVVFPVGKYSSPIFRSYRIDTKQVAVMNFPEYDEVKRSQDLPEAYFDAGQFYWFYPEKLKKIDNKNSFGKVKGVVVLEDCEVQDIDQPSDWQIAELKYNFIQSNASYKTQF
jgi:N-acylneuraminate cytidylyltransferase